MILYNDKYQMLDIIRCYCRQSSTREGFTVKRHVTIFIFKLLVLLFNRCFDHTLTTRGLSHHFNKFHMNVFEFEEKLEANSLIWPFRYFGEWRNAIYRKIPCRRYLWNVGSSWGFNVFAHVLKSRANVLARKYQGRSGTIKTDLVSQDHKGC